ncbi:MAG: 2-amino-4-hydroxy-6-hydroxymethyldihydropteridine diphosphokinase [Candidatus Nanopelagicales bacterium]
MARVALGLGANLGDRLQALQTAVDVVVRDPAVRAIAVSPLVETDPVGGPDQPDYLNAVLIIETTLPPLEVLALAQLAEAECGRTREVRWGARTLDVDVLDYEDALSSDPILTLPHPRAQERGFVLVPWAGADPDYVVSGTTIRVADALAALGEAGQDGVRKRDDLFLALPDGHTVTP